MKIRIHSIVLAIFAIVFTSAAGAGAQEHQHQQGAQKPPAQTNKQGGMDMSAMTNEPHHLLAMAYVQNISTFAATLHMQAGQDKPLDAEFARAVAGEIRRSFDSFQQHLQESKNSVPADMQSQMGMMMQGSYEHISAIRQHLTQLEKDVQPDALNSKSITEHAAQIHIHADEMSKSHGGHEGHKI